MSRDAFKLDVVSIRLVRDAPIYSDQKLNSPQAAVHLVGEVLCDMDRELVCVINLKADGTPINCSFVSAGTLDYSVVNPRDMLKASILSNAARLIMVHNHPYEGTESGVTEGNGCACAKGYHSFVFLSGYTGHKDDGDPQTVRKCTVMC